MLAMVVRRRLVTGLAQLAQDGIASLGRADRKLRLAEVVSALADAKVAVDELQKQLFEREQPIPQFETKAEVRGNLKWRDHERYSP